jgi:hypothetical protein
MRIPHVKFHHSVWTSSFCGVCAMGIMFCALSVGATEPAVPWECTTFVGEAQDRCIRTFVELQQEKIAKLEKDLEVQQQTVQQLQQQMAQQASTTAELERQLTHKSSRWYGPPSVHVYPPLGLSLRFGRDRFFGGSLWYGTPRYFGPRFYGHGHRRWHRH